MTTRGIRNNNPGNIERNTTKWQGMAADQSGDPRFVVFTAPKYGIRALARTLLTYKEKHGLDTVAKIIARWAPPTNDQGQLENNTKAYVMSVAGQIRCGPDDPLDLDDCNVMLPLVKAIIAHENGTQPYSDDELLDGLYAAGINGAPAPPPPAPPIVVQAPPPAVVETQRAATDKAVWGAGFAAAIPLVLAAGPFVFQKLGMDQVTAYNTANSLAMLFGGSSANLTLMGRGSANIKPLG